MNIRSIRLLFLLVGGLLCGFSYGQSKDQFDHLFSAYDDLDELQPGVSVAVIKNEKVIYNKSFGYANLEYQIPLDNKSVFDIASLAKQFTGFAIAKLIVENKLNLSDSVSTYIPEIKLLNKGILVKHLVYHTSGLRDIGELFGLAYVGENLTSKEALQIVQDQKELNFPVGSAYDYSNTNYVLLALIVERISGVSLREWSAANLFEPLQMKHSFVNDNPYEIIPNRAVAYNRYDESFSFLQNNGMALIGSSAVYSTIDDMIIWLQALQSEKHFPRVFSLMKQKGKLDSGEPVNYGFGLSIGSFKNELMVEHTGATPAGFNTALAIFPDHSLAIAILSNRGDVNPIHDFGIGIINKFLPTVEQDQNESSNAETPESGQILSQEITNRYIGEYLFNNEMKVKISITDDEQLKVQLEGQEERPVFPISVTEFDFPALKSKLNFVVNADNSCNRVEITMNGNQEGTLVRVKPEELRPIDKNKYIGLFYSDELKIVFEIGVIDNQIAIINSKDGEVKLTNKTEKIFASENGMASSVEFIFNPHNEVTGFRLNRGSRARNIKFVKIDLDQ